jgi:glycerol-3-phosphate cytidylyltransferase
LGPCTLTYGTFDVPHYGHIRLLARARALGLPVCIGLSTDAFNEAKGKEARLSYEERRDLLLELKAVTHVFPEETWAQKADDIRRLDARYFVMGDDWSGHFDELSSLCEVRYFPRTHLISSTEIRSISR